MLQFPSTILSNTRLSDAYHRLVFSWAADAGKPMPGQFVTVRMGEGTSPLLRRPFALSGYDAKRGTGEFIYTRRGAATEMLAGRESGDGIDVIGPMGNSLVACRRGADATTPRRQDAANPMVPTDEATRADKFSSDGLVIAVAGGTGLGPMVFWVRYLKGQGVRNRLVFGCRTAAMVPEGELFEGLETVLCTDDGSRGFKGTTVDYLRSVESEITGATVVCACGPTPMLRACHELAVRHGIPCWVSLEQTMACGVGACMGCVVKVRGEQKYARVCKEGPVFRSEDVVWG